MEDRESAQERHRVGHQVRSADEDEPRNRPQAHRQSEVVREAGRQREEGDGARGYQPERQRLLEQVWPALPFPGPTAQYVADCGAGEPGHRRRHRRPKLQRAEAHEQRDLTRRKREGRAEREPGKPPADCSDAVRVHCPDHALMAHGPNYSAQRQCHCYLSLRVVVTDNSGSIWAFGHEPTAGS